MNLLKILLMGLFGAVSATLLAVPLIALQTLIPIVPGTLFGLMIFVGLKIIYKNRTKPSQAVLFIIFSCAAYIFSEFIIFASSVLWVQVSSPTMSGTNILPEIICWFMAGLLGAFVMLLGLQKILPIKFKFSQIALLSLAGGIAGTVYVAFFTKNPDTFFMLYYIWNTIMAMGIGVVLNKNQNKWQSNSHPTAPRGK